MLKKLTDEQLNDILEAGIAEFAFRGPERAAVKDIAARAGVSVGVMYKYYENKEALFLACLRHALAGLSRAVEGALAGECTVTGRAEKLILAVQKSARENPSHHILYHELTAGAAANRAGELAREIEGVTAGVYTAMLADAAREGRARADMDPRLFAFFFDNLLMMLQFSYSCEYYRERFALYCGADAADDAHVAAELVKFIGAAFGEK